MQHGMYKEQMLDLTKLYLPELILAMKDIVNGFGMYAAIDTLTDVSCLVDWVGDSKPRNVKWCVRQNGTYLAETDADVEKWLVFYEDEELSVYEISYADGFFNIKGLV